MVGPTVIVKQGWLRGIEVKNVLGGTYTAFKGIPYAAPPVGRLRFKDPVPPEPWTGFRDAFTEGPRCPQVNFLTKEYVGEEDCLYLNVATTSLHAKRPVMVWIHGGGFMTGSGGSEEYSPDYLIKEDIVFVSMNYRVGILGFLDLHDKAAPGNFGIKDQIAALKWVKENIKQFGGDPDNVTIFGESAGSASVHYLLLSPLAKGLFHKAIGQSGVASNRWACISRPIELMHQLVSTLGKDTTDPQEIVDYLRTLPVADLIAAQETVKNPEDQALIQLPFGPGLDHASDEPLIPGSLDDLVAKGFDVPVILGYNSHEGLMFLSEFPPESLEKINQNFEGMIPRNLIAKAPSKISEMAEELRKFYFADNDVNVETINLFAQMIGDLNFALGILDVADIQRSKKTRTYLYRFSYDSPQSIFKKLLKIEYKGTMHAEDLRFLFYPSIFKEHVDLDPESTDRIVSNRFVKMWTNFAKTGNPTPEIDELISTQWKPISSSAMNYLEISDELTVGENPSEDAWQNWKRILNIASEDRQ